MLTLRENWWGWRGVEVGGERRLGDWVPHCSPSKSLPKHSNRFNFSPVLLGNLVLHLVNVFPKDACEGNGMHE